MPIGDQVIFEYNLEKWKNSKTNEGSSSENFQNKNILDNNTYENKNVPISVMEILNNTFNGKEILKYYTKNNALHDEQRNLLISTVTKYIEAKGIKCSLSECNEIEIQICNMFPNEKLVRL